MPKEFHVSRATDIAATPEQILPFLIDLKKWQQWSPWEDIDPALERAYGGPDQGVGAIYEWRGNNKAGAGRMEILEASPENVAIDLHFSAPMKAHNRIDLRLTPTEVPGVAGPSTRVVWTMTGPQNLVMRMMSVFWSMEKMIAPDFEKGLRQLKAAVEK